MIEWIIRRSVANRFLGHDGALFLSIWGTWTIINTPVDALPDLSDVQVIIKTSYPGRGPADCRKPRVTLSAYHHHAVRARRKNRAWFFTVRGFVCVCHFLKTAPICTGRALACWSI
ncbi:hypothetical protein ACP0HM_36400 [Escherichia coli]